jgi:Zn-dependent protease
LIIFTVILSFVVILFSLSVHEASHAFIADRLGDSTAKDLGRISLNPLIHIDLFGTVILPLLLALSGAGVFGWAKPVPVNPNNFRHPLRDDALVALAGPMSNLALAIISALLLRLFIGQGQSIDATAFQSFITLLLYYLIQINVFLAIFNLIPIPPLDGSGIIRALLPYKWLVWYVQIERYGFVILLVFVMTGLSQFILLPAGNFVMKIIGLVSGLDF